MCNLKRSCFIHIFAAFFIAVWSVQPCMAIIISEIMYHPVEEGSVPSGDETLEFIELYNNRAVFEDLSGYAFTNGVDYVFPEGTILGAKEYLVIALDPDAVEAAYDITGVLGPFDGRLNNNGERIELSNANGEIIISLRYNDSRPWPSTTDGTGHTIILSKPGFDPEEGSSWSASTYIGGTPGKSDFVQVDPVDPQLVTLIEKGHPGSYFKGTKEPSPGAGGAATTAWTQIGFTENSDWLNGPSGYGYSNNSVELEPVKTVLDDMRGGYISVYARLPFTLTQEQIDSFTQLSSEVNYDDNYILYLNGVRVSASSGLGDDPLPYSQAANSASDYPTVNIDLTGSLNLLQAGTNILSIQVHNATIGNSSDCIASAALRGVMEEEPPAGDDPRGRVVINELLTNSDLPPGTDWLELYNPGPIAVDLSNVYISDGRFELLQYKIPDGIVLQPGEFWAVHQGTPPNGFPFGLGFAGETVFLTAATDDPEPTPIRILDAVRFGTVEADITIGRYPDGGESIVAMSGPTYEGHNGRPLMRDIVINEIMYHHGTRDDRYQFIELYNRGNATVDLSGWSFQDGITYEFPQGTQIAAGAYMVIARDSVLLEGVYDNLTIGVNLLGDYTGKLDHHSERVQLSYPIIEVNPDTGQDETYWVTVDEVTYYDGGRWPEWADGIGSSMELRDPHSENNSPDAWADSDESSKAVWEQFSFTINNNDSKYTHDNVNIFSLIMLNKGEVLIDDLELIIDGSQKLTNKGFESGLSSWRHLGNHVQSFSTSSDKHSGSNALHLIATGHGDPGANRVNQSLTSVRAGTVTFRGWAKRLKGSRYLLLRLSRELAPVQPPRPSHAFELDMPLNQGTPGEQNTSYVTNRGPDINNVKHWPVLPTAGEPIVVTTTVGDNNGVDDVTLRYRSEGTSTFTSVDMVDDGSGDDGIAGDSIYTATIPGASAGTMRAFYIEASDGSSQRRFPTELHDSADVPNRTCLVRVGDSLLSTEFATYRVWMSNDVVNTFTGRANLSNELMDCTFVYNETEVFYNAHIRLRGSPFLRGGSGRSPTGRYGYRIEFNPDQKFGAREEINLDNTEGGNRGPLQERASLWFYRQMGLEYSTQEYVRPVFNGTTYTSYEDVQKIDGDYIAGWFPDDDEGFIHKIDDYFEYDAEGTNKSNYDEGLKYDNNHPLLKETYRWGFEKRSNRESDNWDHLFDFAVAMNTPSSSPAYEEIIESFIHPEHFARVLAIRHAVGDWDSYGYNRGKNNYFYYALPEGKWYLLPWDIDFTLGSGNGPTTNLFAMNAGQFPEVYQFLNYPKYRRMYLQAFAEMVNGPWKSAYGTAYPPTAFDIFVDDSADALVADGAGDGRRNGIKQFVRDRRNYILTQIPSMVFEITTNGGDDFCTSEEIIIIEGVAPLEVAAISVNGTSLPAEFTGNNAFSVNVPVETGSNLLTVVGLDGVGNPVSGGSDTITVTRIAPSTINSVNPGVTCNSGTAELTIDGSGFDPGSMTTVSFATASEEIGFDALYVQASSSFDAVQAATVLLDNPAGGVGDAVETVHTSINLLNGGSDGVFSPSNAFAAPFNTGDPSNFAIRFSGYIYADSPGVRYFGVNSDDGFSLRIDGQLVGEYAGARAANTTDVTQNRTAGTMTFDFPAAGTYYLELDFYENGGGEEVEFFQTNSTGGDTRLINVNSELVVFRDDVTRIDAVNVEVTDENTITCEVNLDGAEPGLWDLTVTPECGQAAQSFLDDALEITTAPVGSVAWSVSPVGPSKTLGRSGGSFQPNHLDLTISNTGDETIEWTVSKGSSADWLDLPAIVSKSLAAGLNETVTVPLNSTAQTLGVGVYLCPLVFSIGCNPTGPSVIQREVRLTVTYRSDFNLDLSVTNLDLAYLAEAWLESCSEPVWCGEVDLDRNGQVGISDLAIFADELSGI